MTAFQSSDINMQNAIRPNLNNDGIQANPFQPRLLPADVKLQAPIQKDTVAFTQAKAIPQNQETEETEQTEQTEQQFVQQPQQKKIPTWGKVLGGVAIAAATIAGIAVYDHLKNNGQWRKNITNLWGAKAQDVAKKDKGESIKSITDDFYGEVSSKIQDRINNYNQKINSLKPSETNLKKYYEENISTLTEEKAEWDKAKEYFDLKAKEIHTRGKLETEYMEFAREVAEKQKNTPHYNFSKDKDMKAKWDRIENKLFVRHQDAETKLKQFIEEKSSPDPFYHSYSKALTQKFEYEIKERAKKGTLTKNDINYINGTTNEAFSMFKTMKYDNGKLYDCRNSMKNFSSVSMDPKDLTKLADAEENLPSIIKNYEKSMEKHKVLFDLGTKSPEQIDALEKWSGYSYDVGKRTFDPNYYRKKAANLVTAECFGVLDWDSDGIRYMQKELKNPEVKQQFIERWNESPTLLNIRDIRNNNETLEIKIAGRKGKKDEWVDLFSHSKHYKKRTAWLPKKVEVSDNNRRYYDVARENWSKKAGYTVSENGSLEQITPNTGWYTGAKTYGIQQRVAEAVTEE